MISQQQRWFTNFPSQGIANPYGADFAPPFQAIRVNYSNDKHEKFDAFPYLIESFKRKTRDAERQNIPVVNVDAGDWNISYEPDQLDLDVRLLNMMLMHVVTLGNHDFDGGTHPLAEALKNAQFTTFASNLKIPKTSSLHRRVEDGKVETRYRIFSYPNGLQLGVIGITVPNLKNYMNAKVDLQGVDSLDEVQTLKLLQRTVNELQQQHGVNKILLVSHAGFPYDSRKIARTVKGIDIIVGGHSHTTLEGIKPEVNYVKSPSGEPVMIVSTGKDGKAFGVLDAVFDTFGRIIPLSNTLFNPRKFPKDIPSQHLINRFLGQEKIIGYVPRQIETDSAAHDGENGLADKIADAMRISTHSDIALFKGNEIRNTIYAGKFSDRDLKILLPFEDNMVQLKLTGMDLIKILAESGRCIRDEDSHPSMMHPSGLEYVVDKQTGKILRATVINPQTGAAEPLEKDKIYTVAVTSYLVYNPKEYSVIAKDKVVQEFPFSIRDAFGVMLKKMAAAGPLAFPTDGRVIVLNDDIHEEDAIRNSPEIEPLLFGVNPFRSFENPYPFEYAMRPTGW